MERCFHDELVVLKNGKVDYFVRWVLTNFHRIMDNKLFQNNHTNLEIHIESTNIRNYSDTYTFF